VNERDLSQPDSLLAQFVDETVDDLEWALAEAGFGKMRMLVVIHCDQAPLGEKDSLVAGFGYDDSRDLLPDLAQHMIAVGRAHGLKVVVAPLGQG
jgi:hypothetical protein